MNMIKARKYSGQAIAIIMVVLVVATVIGASLYSRVVRNRQLLIETRESARALEQADSLLDLMINSDLVRLQETLDECIEAAGNGVCELDGLADFSQAFSGVIDQGMTGKIADWCDAGQDESSRLKVLGAYAGINDYQEWAVGSVMALRLGYGGFANPCNLTLGFKGLGSGADDLFTIKYVYANVNGNVKPYEEDDMLLYCYTKNDSCSSGSVAPLASLERTLSSSDNVITVNLGQTVGEEYRLYEIRVLPLKGKIGVSLEIPECAESLSRNYKVNAQVNCKGDYREKQIVMPNVKHLGYPAIFDYTIYNASGVLKPN